MATETDRQTDRQTLRWPLHGTGGVGQVPHHPRPPREAAREPDHRLAIGNVLCGASRVAEWPVEGRVPAVGAEEDSRLDDEQKQW